MAFVTKEWKDRLVEYAGRRKLKNVATGEEIVYDVSRQEGAVSQAGDAFAAEPMNDLEQRISDEFNQINQNLGGNILSYNESEDAYYIQYGADSVPKKLGSPEPMTLTGYLLANRGAYIRVPMDNYKYVQESHVVSSGKVSTIVTRNGTFGEPGSWIQYKYIEDGLCTYYITVYN